MNTPTISLTEDQRNLLNFYINQYNQIHNDIDYLYSVLDIIRGNIDLLTRHLYPSNTSSTLRTPTQYNNVFRNNLPTITRFRNNNGGGNGNQPSFSYFPQPSRISTNNNIQTTNHNDFHPVPISTIPDILSRFFSNVPIVPTTEQINNAVVYCNYRDISNPINTSCPIELTTFNNNDEVMQIRYCGHIFHRNSLTSWFQNNVICPMCRYDIRNYTTSTNEEHEVIRTTTSNSIEDERDNFTHSSSTTNTSPYHSSQIPNTNINSLFSNSQSITNATTRPTQQTIESLVNIFTDPSLNLLNTLLQTPTSLQPQTQNGTRNIDFLFYEPLVDLSHNILVYETYFRFPSSRDGNNTQNNNRSL